ncbi:helix-turn-helix domain-containing protein [Saccharopolyspora erythraea]|uniref:helix-turn-helix domain-containing protein n=1 Tax=Saccharopolyspora erythraea TaxID=1836 RepID=UPI001BA51B4B|nr:helix-turn-helix transcriptional regulator [Saccharopolyspora erythraea]QUH05153.1 helix-turn-helix domain-containing protein [Saccharopolyspora erythraea]
MSDTPRARALAKELRAARKAAGLTLRELSERVGWSESKLSRLETAQRGLKPAAMTVVLDALGVTGSERDHLLKMAREIKQPTWWEFGGGLPTQLTELADAESRAVRITEVSEVLVPGLLQTREHSRALFAATGVEPERIEQRTAVRQVRQGILTKAEPVEYLVILDEAVLCRAVGGPKVMADQLRAMLKAAERPNITIQVVPFSAGAHTGLDGSFLILEFVRDRPIVHLEQRRSGAFLNDPDDVAPFFVARSNLQQAAMSPDETGDLIVAYAQRYDREE